MSEEQKNTPSHVAILLCTYNGENYLREQIDSFYTQTHQDWSLHVSDDGSSDQTIPLIESYKAKEPNHSITIHNGPRKGFCRNFLSLITRSTIKADYYAFCDQDDIWFNEKIERGVSWLETVPSDIPALYCTTTTLTDSAGKPIETPPAYTKPPSFQNALTQNITSGNTMIMNDAARNLLMHFQEADLPAHDWFTYILVTGAGGQVQYDTAPSIYYRQHGGNVIGIQTGLKSNIDRAKRLLGNRYKNWITQNLKALKQHQTLLTQDNAATVDNLIIARKAPLFKRISRFRHLGLYRQTVTGTLALWFLIIFKKI